jgi:acetamidase/formamidase
MHHPRIEATPDTVHWGYFDAALEPILTVDPGDTVTISTVSGGPELVEGTDLRIPDELAAIHERLTPPLRGHICTGPIAVRGARAGQVLEVRIQQTELTYDWGYTFVAPLAGGLPDDFDERTLFHIALDRRRMVGRLPWGLEVPLRPFFGVMGVAPPPAWGRVSSIQPRRHGGNMDNRELVAGTTLFLPIHVDGARFSVGDGHAAQGDGEVSGTAIETGLAGTFELHVRDDVDGVPLRWPMAETPTHLMTMAFDPDLDDAAEIAVRSMLDVIVARSGRTREEALMLCSHAADLRVTQIVNDHKGIHVMLEKRLLGERS